MGHKSNIESTMDNLQSSMIHVETLMQQALSEHVFPGAVLLVSRQGCLVFHKAYGFSDLFSRHPMTMETIFDLASLTKPLATALAIMILIQQGKLGLEQNLCAVLPAFKDGQKSAIKVKHLLYHNSGLADYRPFYKDVEHLEYGQRKNALRKLLVTEPLIHPVGTRTVYSDIGFMILEWMVEYICEKQLDRFVSEMIYSPLGLGNLFFVDLNAAQQQNFDALAELVAGIVTEARADREAQMQEIGALLDEPSFNQARALELIGQKPDLVNEKAPLVISSLAVFLDSLTPEQKDKLQEFIEHRRNHHRHHHESEG